MTTPPIDLSVYCVTQEEWDSPNACSEIIDFRHPNHFYDNETAISSEVSKHILLSDELQCIHMRLKYDKTEDMYIHRPFKFWLLKITLLDNNTLYVRMEKENDYYLAYPTMMPPYIDTNSLFMGMIIAQQQSNNSYVLK
jgi:hypothetical protein